MTKRRRNNNALSPELEVHHERSSASLSPLPAVSSNDKHSQSSEADSTDNQPQQLPAGAVAPVSTPAFSPLTPFHMTSASSSLPSSAST